MHGTEKARPSCLSTIHLFLYGGESTQMWLLVLSSGWIHHWKAALRSNSLHASCLVTVLVKVQISMDM